MGKYIGFNYKYDSVCSERIRLLEASGFDGVFIYSQYNPLDYIDTLVSSTLRIETLHLPYKKFENGKCIDSRFVNVLWTDCTDADDYLNTLLVEVDFAARYNINTVVMHITGGDEPPPKNQFAISRITQLVDKCKKHGIVLCLENLRRLDYLEYIFEHIDSPNLKFCFDSGHANAMTHNVDEFPWDTFGKYLYCLHLNDNDGIKDQHLIPFSGNIDWATLMKKIYSLAPQVDLTLEVRSSPEDRDQFSEIEFLSHCFNSLIQLEKYKWRL